MSTKIEVWLYKRGWENNSDEYIVYNIKTQWNLQVLGEDFRPLKTVLLFVELTLDFPQSKVNVSYPCIHWANLVFASLVNQIPPVSEISIQ